MLKQQFWRVNNTKVDKEKDALVVDCMTDVQSV